MYLFGAFLMSFADAQKNYTLVLIKKRPILINDGFFKYTRNPNFLGEIILYFSFAYLTNHWLSYSIMAFAFSTVLAGRMW